MVGRDPRRARVTGATADGGTQRLEALVLVGASAGGLPVLRRLLTDLPADLPAAVLAVVHLPSRPVRPLVELVPTSCALDVGEVEGSHALRRGEVLVAPPDRHLEVVGDEVRLSEQPRHNGVRPSVDVLFDSAARAFGPRVVAVVLSGAMRDGALGAARVERAGGRVVVQDPREAMVSGMPVSALEATSQHAVVAADALAAEVVRHVRHLVGSGA